MPTFNEETMILESAHHVHECQPLSYYVKQALENYFSQLGDQEPANLYELVLEEVEKPLLEAVMRYTKNNQSRAAILLGLSRSTLLKKLKIYKI
jgi:Fis family transcriptional regulator